MLLTRVLAALLIVAAAMAVGQTWRLGALKNKIAKAEAENSQLAANLTEQSNAVKEIQRLAEQRAAEAKKAKAEAQTLRRQKESRAQGILSLPKPSGDECAAASDLIRKELAK